MGLFSSFNRKMQLQELQCEDSAIVAMADGEMIDVATVPDPVFSQKMMGESIAFRYSGSRVTICAPANGTLSVLFPTGHAFGITTTQGVDLLVHIGIDTVNAKGNGFKLLEYLQGDKVLAGSPIVEVNLKELGAKYDMSTMLIITNPNGHQIQFKKPQPVKRGDSIIL